LNHFKIQTTFKFEQSLKSSQQTEPQKTQKPTQKTRKHNQKVKPEKIIQKKTLMDHIPYPSARGRSLGFVA
jgi:hypothetical protein